MNVARYWARADIDARSPDGLPCHRSVIRGSDISEADAKQ